MSQLYVKPTMCKYTIIIVHEVPNPSIILCNAAGFGVCDYVGAFM